ncbi:MAG: hypothetical protein IH912_11355 [Proteobacteria bacterium]|nr:hypothetical protein [Pseudomonadota bacterium]
MVKVYAMVLLALSTGLPGTVNAQNLDMSGAEGSSTFDQAGKPTRGMTEERVRASFGAPQSTVAAVGDPPISRWEYAEFVVFFEYDRVIHAVTKR